METKTFSKLSEVLANSLLSSAGFDPSHDLSDISALEAEVKSVKGQFVLRLVYLNLRSGNLKIELYLQREFL